MPVRIATLEDAEGVARVHVESWQHAYREILPAEYLASLSVEKRRAMWADAIAKDHPTVLVAEAESQVAGFSAVGRCRDEGAAVEDQEIWAIYVSPAHWMRGIGRELWRASRELAIARRARRISLWVIANNERAIGFYESMGLERDAAMLKPFELGGAQLKEVRYAQALIA